MGRRMEARRSGQEHRSARVGEPCLPVAAHLTVSRLVELAEVGIGFLDEDLRFVAANEALALRLGATDVVGQSLSELHGASGARVEGLLAEVLRTGKPVTVGGRTTRIAYHRVVDEAAHRSGSAPSRSSRPAWARPSCAWRRTPTG